MQEFPKISIIIPIYNVEEYIAECLQSVMRQTYGGEMECILVDDCGTDDSMSIIKEQITTYKGKIVFRILCHERNRGLSAARNTGTEAATGEYIYYLDSDDYISDDCIETLAVPLSARKYDIVMGDYRMYGNRQDPSLLHETRNEIIGNEAIFVSYADQKIYVMAWNKLCKTSFLRDNNITFLEGQLHEDNLWTYKVMLSIQSLYIVHQVVYYYRVRACSITTETINSQQKLAAFSDTIKYIQTHPYYNANLYVECLVYYWKIYLYMAWANRLDFFQDYRALRQSCPVNPIRSLLVGKISIIQFKAMWHLMLPPSVAYKAIQRRYNRNIRN